MVLFGAEGGRGKRPAGSGRDAREQYAGFTSGGPACRESCAIESKALPKTLLRLLMTLLMTLRFQSIK